MLLLPTISAAQDVYGWQSLLQLNRDDKVRVSRIKGKSVTGQFQDWTAERLTVAGVTVKKDEVRKVERFRAVGRGRARRAGLAALIGFGGGFVLGAAVGGDCGGSFGPCLSRPASALLLGCLGAVFGGASVAFMPRRNKDLIYVWVK